MTKFLTYLLVVFPLAVFAQQNTLLTGQVKNHKGTQVSLSWPNLLGDGEEEVTAAVDKKGYFRFSFALDRGREMNFHVGNEQTRLYLFPGDSLHLTLNTKAVDESVKYSGKNAGCSQYLAAYYLTFEDDAKKLTSTEVAAIYAVKKYTPQEYLAYTDKQMFQDLQYLESWKDRLPEAFYEEEKLVISYKWSDLKLIYPSYKYMFTRNTDHPVMPESTPASYFSFLEEMNLHNDRAVHLQTYRNTVREALEFFSKTSLMTQSTPEEVFMAKWSDASRIYRNKTLEYLRAELLLDGYENVSMKTMDDPTHEFLLQAENEELKRYVTERFNIARRLAPGQQAPHFSLQNEAGKTISLGDLKGKLIYLDFWASWCGPCIEQMPHAKKVKEAYAGKDILFVYISVDETEKAWKKGIEKHNIEGIHLWAKGFRNETAQAYNVRGIPRYVLIGRDGTILNNKPPRPSSKQLPEVLDKALLP